MKKFLALLIAALVTLTGGFALATPAAATAECVPSPGQPYIAPTAAVPGIPAVPGKPAVPAVPEQPATYVQLWEYTHAQDGQGNGRGPDNRWEVDGWNANDNPSSVGWVKTGQHRDSDVILTPYVAGTPEIPAVAEVPAVAEIPGAPGQPYIAPVTCEPVGPTPREVPACYSTGTDVLNAADFVYSDTRATGHKEFTASGLRIWTESNTSTDKVAEYWVINKDLADIGVPSLDYDAETGIEPGLQLVMDYDADGIQDGILVGETVYGNDWWASNGSKQFVKDGAPSHTGGSGSENHGTLSQWLTAFPNAQVLLGGFSMGSGVLASGTLHSVTIGCLTYTFAYTPPPSLVECTELGSNLSTNLDPNGWTLSEGATYVDGGVRLDVEGDWSEATLTRALTGDLADLGTGIDFTPGAQYLGLHVKTSIGTLVYEQEPSYAGKWWSNADFGVEAGMGYTTFATLSDIVAANPGVTLVSLTVLYTSPVQASTTVTEVTIGCTVYTFDYERPIPVQPADKVVTGEYTEGVPQCDDTRVARTRTISTIPYVFDQNEWVWVLDEEHAEVVIEDGFRDLLASEFTACPVVVPPVVTPPVVVVVTPPVVTPVVTPQVTVVPVGGVAAGSGPLASTGVDGLPWMLGGGLGLIGLGSIAMMIGRRRMTAPVKH